MSYTITLVRTAKPKKKKDLPTRKPIKGGATVKIQTY
jgi:hypothetical protein